MNLILLGPPGAGKGTQAVLLQKKYGLCHLSTGEMLRETVAAGGEIGKELQSIISAGKLVPDEIIVKMLQERVRQADCAAGFILDGFPRNESQAHALDEMLAREEKSLDYVIEFRVSDEEMIERISGRYACAQCKEGYHDIYKKPKIEGVCDVCGGAEFVRRADDRPETVRKRLESYHEQTAPLLPYYKERGVLRSVDGMADIDTVTGQINAIFGA